MDFIGFVINTPSPIFALRMPDLKAPGDYFRHRPGAEKTKITSSEINEIRSTINSTITGEYYDSYVLENLNGYYYEMLEGEVKRKEYYVKYGKGDTIFVISGLLGEFLSFYRAIPGDFRISIDQLKAEARELSPVLEFNYNDGFVEMENDFIYFVEYVNKNEMLRIRNYQVAEYWQNEEKVRKKPKGKYYNLIEITKFLDEEAMP